VREIEVEGQRERACASVCVRERDIVWSRVKERERAKGREGKRERDTEREK